MTTFKLPDLGEGLPDAEIRQWYVSVGDEVKLDQPLVAMETAKAVVDIPSPCTGRIDKLYGQPGDIIQTGAPLIGFTEAGAPQTAATADSGTVVGVIEASNTILEESPTGVEVNISSRTTVKAIPAVRALANKLNINLNSVTGTGAGGTITAEDVHQAATALAHNAPSGEALHGVRRIMAIQMAKSHQEVAATTLMEDADVVNWPKQIDVSIRLLQAVIKACQTEPALNAHFYSQSISRKLWSEINIGIAVDTSAGLYVPVIKDAAQLSSEALRALLNTFKSKAASQSFTPEDLQNPTITLSNFGTISGRYASPVVMPPTVAILAIGKARDQVVAQDGKAVIHPIIPVSLTFDHRAATGGEAARFLAAFIQSLEQPE